MQVHRSVREGLEDLDRTRRRIPDAANPLRSSSNAAPPCGAAPAWVSVSAGGHRRGGAPLCMVHQARHCGAQRQRLVSLFPKDPLARGLNPNTPPVVTLRASTRVSCCMSPTRDVVAREPKSSPSSLFGSSYSNASRLALFFRGGPPCTCRPPYLGAPGAVSSHLPLPGQGCGGERVSRR